MLNILRSQLITLSAGSSRILSHNLRCGSSINTNCRQTLRRYGSAVKTTKTAINMGKCVQLTSENIQEFLDSFDTVLLDCDGVIWHGMEEESGACDTIKKLRKLGKSPFFVTNNSTKSRKQYTHKFDKLGFEASENEVFGTAYMAARYLKENLKITGKIYLIGGSGLEEELTLQGLKYIGPGPDPIIEGDVPAWSHIPLDPEVEAVLVGFDQHFCYTKTLKAASYLSNPKIHFVATNMDGRLPTKTGRVIPGTGSIVTPVKVASNREPEIIGKPTNHIVECISKSHKIDPKRTLMIGDRLDTDILMGHNCGTHTALVLSGISSLQEAQQHQASGCPERMKLVPDYYMPALGVLGKLIDAVQAKEL